MKTIRLVALVMFAAFATVAVGAVGTASAETTQMCTAEPEVIKGEYLQCKSGTAISQTHINGEAKEVTISGGGTGATSLWCSEAHFTDASAKGSKGAVTLNNIVLIWGLCETYGSPCVLTSEVNSRSSYTGSIEYSNVAGEYKVTLTNPETEFTMYCLGLNVVCKYFKSQSPLAAGSNSLQNWAFSASVGPGGFCPKGTFQANFKIRRIEDAGDPPPGPLYIARQ